jgi:hypothetical protein
MRLALFVAPQVHATCEVQRRTSDFAIIECNFELKGRVFDLIAGRNGSAQTLTDTESAAMFAAIRSAHRQMLAQPDCAERLQVSRSKLLMS